MSLNKSLYDALLEEGLIDADVDVECAPCVRDAATLSGKAFARAVLRSEEFRQYVVSGLLDMTLPAGVLLRLMDYGWGKPAERVEHSGIEGQPVEVITRIVRVVVDPESKRDDEVVH